jgi:uncharacterized protein (TIGR02145 family)
MKMKALRKIVLSVLLISAWGCKKDPETIIKIELFTPTMDEVIRDVSVVKYHYSLVVTKDGNELNVSTEQYLWMGTDPDHLELIGPSWWDGKMKDLKYGNTYYWQIEAILDNEKKSFYSEVGRFHTSLPNVTNIKTDTEDMTLNITWEDSPLMEYLELRLTPELAEKPNPIRVNKGIGSLVLNGLTNIVRYDIHFQAVDASGYSSLPDSTWNISVDPTVSIKDADKNVYNIVTIGNQIWMRDNLKATTYSDSENAFPEYTHHAVITPSGNKERFYNGHRLKQLLELGNPCPCGFRVPTDEDFIELERYAQMPEEDLYLLSVETETRGGDEQIARFFKSKEGWVAHESVKPGVDFFGFNAYPVGSYSYESNYKGHKYYGQTVGYLTQTFDARDSSSGEVALFRYFNSTDNGI